MKLRDVTSKLCVFDYSYNIHAKMNDILYDNLSVEARFHIILLGILNNDWMFIKDAIDEVKRYS
jgi:hypothetical protein